MTRQELVHAIWAEQGELDLHLKLLCPNSEDNLLEIVQTRALNLLVKIYTARKVWEVSPK